MIPAAAADDPWGLPSDIVMTEPVALVPYGMTQPATAELTVRLGRRDGKAGTRKMHKDLANSGVVTLDGDLIDA